MSFCELGSYPKPLDDIDGAAHRAMVDVKVCALADVLKDAMNGIRERRCGQEPDIFVVLTHRFVVALFLKKSFALAPRDDDLDRVDIVDQPGMRVDPSGLPLPAANMLEQLNAFERNGLEAGPFAKAVFLAATELFMHHVRIMA